MPEGTRQFWTESGRLPEGLIYPELVHGGLVETLVQNTDAFNAASGGTIRLVTARRRGDFAQESFIKDTPNLINRRTVDNSPENPAVNSDRVPMDEFVTVKVNRRIGPIDQTLDSFRKLGENADLEILSRKIGVQIAKGIQVDQLEAGLTSLVAAISAQAALTHTTSPEVTITTARLVDGLAQFGDAAARVKLWVMHSKVYFDLVKEQIAANIDGISNFNIQTAQPVTLNRPVLVSDSASLVNGSVFTTLGLTEGSVTLEDSEEESLMGDLITGQENLVVRLQGEFAYNVGIRGSAWDVANGGINPDSTALGTGSNWDSVMNDVKDLAGVAIVTI